MWHGFGMVLVWLWYGFGMVLVWFWNDYGMVLVWLGDFDMVLYGFDMRFVCFCML